MASRTVNNLHSVVWLIVSGSQGLRGRSRSRSPITAFGCIMAYSFWLTAFGCMAYSFWLTAFGCMAYSFWRGLRGKSRSRSPAFESLILSHHSRYKVTFEYNQDDFNDEMMIMIARVAWQVAQ